MGANAVHLIINPIPLATQVSLYPQGRELVRNDSKTPTGSVGRGSIISNGNDLRRGFILIALTKRTKSAHGPSDF
jgi:hypothetical protein